MEQTMADKQFTEQHNPSVCQCETDWQSVLSAFQQTSADGQEIGCTTPCPAFIAVVEELLRTKAQLAQSQQMLFGRSSEKGATVPGVTDKPESASNIEDSGCPESDKPLVQEAQDPPQDQDQDSSGHEQEDDNTSEPQEKVTPIKSGRGGRPGHKGYGRRIPDNLVTREFHIRVPGEQRVCPITGEEGKSLPMAFWEKSTQIEIVLTAYLNVYYREKLKFDGCAGCPATAHCPLILAGSIPASSPALDNNKEAVVQAAPELPQTIDDGGTCPGPVAEPLQTMSDAEVALSQPLADAIIPAMFPAAPKVRFVTAPEPPQAVNKSKLDHKSIALLIYLKYLLAIPLARISTLLAACGLSLAPSSMTCTFKRHKDLLEKLYLRMAEEVKKFGHANADETRWMSFFHRDGKESFMDWMWVVASEKVVFYILDRSRSSKVLFKWLGKSVQGVLTVDRAPGYKKFAKNVTGVVLSFCWAHFRRDFVRAAVGNALLREWAKHWIGRIFYIYRLNRERLKALGDPEAFPRTQAKLEEAVKKFFDQIITELSDPNLRPAQREVLESAVRHRAGLTIFVHDPLVPLDNNRAERLLRVVALGRKNFYGTYAQWSGEFTAICLTILQTAMMHDLEPMAYIKYYLDICAKAGGVPKDLEPHLPWNIPDAIRQEYGMSKKEQKQCA